MGRRDRPPPAEGGSEMLRYPPRELRFPQGFLQSADQEIRSCSHTTRTLGSDHKAVQATAAVRVSSRSGGH